MSTPEIAPWLPDQDFFTQNQEVLSDIFDVTKKLYPNSGAPEALRMQDGHPTPESIEWMWEKFMGHQHGSIEGHGDKLQLSKSNEAVLMPLVKQLHYGDYSFTAPHIPIEAINATKAFVLGSTPQELTERLLASVNYQPLESNISEIVCLTGQRLRWNIHGERSTREIYDAISKHSAVDIDELIKMSPWASQEAKKIGAEWRQPFATEYQIGRLCIEAVFKDMIDWSEYPVTTLHDQNANPLYYKVINNIIKAVPPREEIATTYNLKDGRKVHALNAKALLRPGAMPRPTSDTQTKEALDLIKLGVNEHVLAVASAPHVRAAMDALVRVLVQSRPHLSRVDMAVGKWVEGVEPIRALGEIPATHKADMRLRAVLANKDPDDQNNWKVNLA